MIFVRDKYFSRRAIGIHVALVGWIVMCALAAWWQVGRAIQGNSLSFLYSIEWPLFAILGLLGWYALLNLEKVTEGQQRAREDEGRQGEQRGREVPRPRRGDGVGEVADRDRAESLHRADRCLGGEALALPLETAPDGWESNSRNSGGTSSGEERNA